MELAFVLLFVLIGTGAIVYAGLHKPVRKSAKADAPVAPPDTDSRADTDGGGDGGGGD